MRKKEHLESKDENHEQFLKTSVRKVKCLGFLKSDKKESWEQMNRT